MDVLEPFLPDLYRTPDHSPSDILQEIQELFFFKQKLTQFLQGDIDIDVFNDCLAQCGIDPYEYWGIVDENIDAVMESGTALESSEVILVRADGSPLSSIY